MKRFLVILCLCFSVGMTLGQFLEVGAFGGVSYYKGDLNPAYDFLGSKAGYGVVARYPIGTRWAVKASGYFGKVTGDDYKSNYLETRGLSFESRITEIATILEFNFFDYFTGSKRDDISPYIFVGLGFFTFNPQTGGIKLQSLGTEGQNVQFAGRKPYNLYSFSMPFGFGVKYSLNSRFSLGFEWGMRKTITDYIDDVSTTYYLIGSQIDANNDAEILSDPTQLHQPMQERGNPETNDWYNFTGMTLTYKFRLFTGRKCPDQEL
jgi:hypothetical protein